jgi:hypothetical protein
MGQEKLHQCFAEFLILHIRSNCGDTILREVNARNLCLAKAKKKEGNGVLDHDASECVYLFLSIDRMPLSSTLPAII